jgi:hypothetical protein
MLLSARGQIWAFGVNSNVLFPMTKKSDWRFSYCVLLMRGSEVLLSNTAPVALRYLLYASNVVRCCKSAYTNLVGVESRSNLPEESKIKIVPVSTKPAVVLVRLTEALALALWFALPYRIDASIPQSLPAGRLSVIGL